MKIADKSVVVTGGASGLALARRFRAEGARGIALADLQEDVLQEAAVEIDALAVPCDVAVEADIKRLVAAAEDAFGPVDVFVSNAGIARMGGVDTPDAEWRQNWDIHVMAHVYAARAVAPKVAARGSGYLVNTASAAGLLSHVESATYTVTKHAAVAFAEWLSIAYGDQGVRISVLCPQTVRTAMLTGRDEGVASLDGVLESEQVADSVIAAMEREEFLILPHPEVHGYVQRKASDRERWLRGMRKLRAAHGGAS